MKWTPATMKRMMFGDLGGTKNAEERNAEIVTRTGRGKERRTGVLFSVASGVAA